MDGSLDQSGFQRTTTVLGEDDDSIVNDSRLQFTGYHSAASTSQNEHRQDLQSRAYARHNSREDHSESAPASLHSHSHSHLGSQSHSLSLSGSRELHLWSFLDSLLEGQGPEEQQQPIEKKFDNKHASTSPSSNAEDMGSSISLTNAESKIPVSKELERAILEPLRFQAQVNRTQRSGDRYIDMLIRAFNDGWLHVPRDRVLVIRRVCIELYMALCMIGDISAGASERRGVPAAHRIFGVPLTLNAANQGYFLAMRGCVELDDLQAEGSNQQSAIEIFTEELLRMHRGQGLDIAWRDSTHCPTEVEYLQMLVDRAGAIPRLAVRLLQLHSSDHAWRHAALEPLINALALFLSLSDDYHSFAGRTENMPLPGVATQSSAPKKGVVVRNTHALAEGRFTLPSVHCIRIARPSETKLSRILALSQEETTDELRSYAITFLEECGSLGYTRSRALEYARNVRSQCEELGGNEILIRVIEEISSRRL